MAEEVKPLPPIKSKISIWNKLKLSFISGLSTILFWVLLFVSINVFIYYVKCFIDLGPFNSETLRYALYLIVGCYFFLVLDKSKIYEALNIKNPPWISKKS